MSLGKLVILCLFSLSTIIVVGSFICIFAGKTVPESLLIIASGSAGSMGTMLANAGIHRNDQGTQVNQNVITGDNATEE